jgi:hypothetical protein
MCVWNLRAGAIDAHQCRVAEMVQVHALARCSRGPRSVLRGRRQLSASGPWNCLNIGAEWARGCSCGFGGKVQKQL